MAINKELLYLVAIDTPDLQRLQIQFVPMVINYKRSSKIQDIAIVGRNDDLRQWTGGNTTLDFVLDFYATSDLGNDAVQKARWLESMTYSDDQKPPSRIKIVFGDLFGDQIWVLADVTIDYTVFQPANNWLPRYAKANLSFKLDTPTNLTATKVRNGIYY
jgi:hypothetical protein